jgi:hypothetical protein
LIVLVIYSSKVTEVLTFGTGPTTSQVTLPDWNAVVVGVSEGEIVEMESLSVDRLLLLGPPQVMQSGTRRSLPPSRKVRALLAYLAMAPRSVTREKLCELFWDVADDPKSELRWCLSKLRPLVDRPTTTRLIADREQVWIDTNSLEIDAVSVVRRRR